MENEDRGMQFNLHVSGERQVFFTTILSRYQGMEFTAHFKRAFRIVLTQLLSDFLYPDHDLTAH